MCIRKYLECRKLCMASNETNIPKSSLRQSLKNLNAQNYGEFTTIVHRSKSFFKKKLNKEKKLYKIPISLTLMQQAILFLCLISRYQGLP